MTTYTNHPELRHYIRVVADFPKLGIPFLDINPLLANRHAMRQALSLMTRLVDGRKIDVVAGLDARGFIFGAAIAERLDVGFVPIRKSSKLPPPKHERPYTTEYSTDTIALGDGLIVPGQHVLVVDDVLATGGTLKAACELICQSGGIPSAITLIEIEDLGGSNQLPQWWIGSVLPY